VVEIILQYILILLLVTGLGYLVYLLSDKDINIVDDYFGLAYVILGSLSDDEATVYNVKKIIRIISKTVQYVETNYKNSENTFKEAEAIKIAKHAIYLLNFKSNIDDESLRYLVRLAATLLPAKAETIEFN
jgi:hypothetical protein